MTPQPNWTTGNYNAWVEAGKTRGERKRRLEQVPEQWRKDVESHVQVVFAIRGFYARKVKPKTGR